jgi:fucose permease
MTKKISIAQVLPVLFAFFVMGFVDVIGIATNHIKEDFGLSDTMTKVLPFMLFIMFLFFSIPTGMLMNRISRRRTVLMSNIITAAALIIPLISYSYVTSLCAFALLGIANTMLQVSLNPLMSNVVQGDRLTSSLTTGQFVKALSSLSSQPLAAICASMFGHWEYIFPIYAGTTILSTLWLMSVRIPKETGIGKASSFKEVFGLLRSGRIAMLFLGILFVVGVDVGVNIAAPELLKERAGATADFAGYGSMVYFVFRALGAFLGAFVLVGSSPAKFFRVTAIVAAAAIAALFFANTAMLLFSLYAVIGLAIANVFAIIFGYALSFRPDKGNEISALMITGVSGGAIISIISGPVSDAMGSQAGSVVVVMACVLYLVFCSFAVSDVKVVE